MMRFGKATETAITALGHLAAVYDGGRTLVSAETIARRRDLQRPWVSKILTTLAAAGLVEGTRGPGGGFTLAREPSDIRLIEAVALFERTDDDAACPFGGGTCGVGPSCPLHDDFLALKRTTDRILEETTLAAFQQAAPPGP